MAHTMSLPRAPVPRMARVKQFLPEDHVSDVREETCRRLRAYGLKDCLRPGARVAITAGSRGIGGFVDLLNGIADAVREAGGEPFLVPAMGSHGGATAEGQAEILHRLGVNDATVAAPISSTMETVLLGTADNGAQVHLDRFAAEADGIIVLGRVKTHPESHGDLASGLLKMVTIGLGKQAGAHQAHSHVLWDSVRAVPRVTLARAKVLCGVAVVENAFRHPAVVEVVPPAYDAFLEADTRLLNVAKTLLAAIPFQDLDLLVVDEIGKTVSGAGMDPNVIGSWRIIGGPKVPDYRRIVVLSLTPASLGNGIGIGLADFTTKRFADAYDPFVTYVNILTASEPGGNTREGLLPLALGSDREAVEVGIFSAVPSGIPRVCRVKNTAELGELWVSEGLMDEVAANPKLSVIEPPAAMDFNEAGNLL